jgi:quinol-cytochrome oxidoreductase complex cytochrome b subunit
MPQQYEGPDRRHEAEHRLYCWENPNGSGHQVRQEVEKMKKRMWMWQGAILLVAALGPTILGVWLSFKLATAKEVANQRESRAEIFRSAHAYPAGDIESEAQSLPGTEIRAKKR